MIWIPQKKAKLQIRIGARNLSTMATAKKSNETQFLVQMPNPTQMQKLFEIL